MKIVLSSLSLSKRLQEIDSDKEWVKSVSIVDGISFLINTNLKTLSLVCDCNIKRLHTTIIDQHNVRWDWIKETVSKVSEQPIVLSITEKQTDLIFQY